MSSSHVKYTQFKVNELQHSNQQYGPLKWKMSSYITLTDHRIVSHQCIFFDFRYFLSFWLNLNLPPQSPRARRHDPGWRTASADQWGAGSVPDAPYSQSDCSWDDLLGVSTLCSPWSGYQELPGGEWPSGENRRLWHVTRYLQHRLLQGKCMYFGYHQAVQCIEHIHAPQWIRPFPFWTIVTFLINNLTTTT